MALTTAPALDADLLLRAQELVQVGTWLWEVDTENVHWSDEMYRIVGLAPQSIKLTPEKYLRAVHPDDRDRVFQAITAAVRHKGKFEFDHRAILPDGSIRYYHARGSVVCDENGRATHVVGACIDITDRAEQQEALRASEERFRAVFDQSAVGIAVTDVEHRIVSANTSFASWLGYRPSELEGVAILDLTHPDDRALMLRTVARIGPSSAQTYEKRYLCKNGGAVWGRATVAPRRDDRGQAAGFVGVVEDITQRKTAHEALQRQSELLQGMLDHLPLMVAVFAPGGELSYLNRAWQEFFEWSLHELDGINSMATVIPDEAHRARALQAMAEGTGEWIDYEAVTASGRKVTTSWACIRLSDGTAVCLGQDITERRALQQRSLQSQKMEALGQLAGGVAHDFNNLLTIISASASFLMEETSANAAARDDVNEIVSACNRAAALTRQLLAFSRREMLQTEIVDVSGTVQTLAKTLGRLIGEHIRFSVETPAVDATVEADRHQLEQVLLNLVVNARDAIQDRGSITISVNTDTREILGGNSREYVVISVADDGAGIEPGVRDRIFEPFFTTKPLGKGTGLGLSTVHGIAEQSGGFVEVDSTIGEGTTFRVYLPKCSACEMPDHEQGGDDTDKGTGTILLVEDDTSLRAVARRVLTTCGYRVLEARHGNDALQVSAKHAGAIDLIITDVVMPELGGREVARAIRARRPDTLILYVSGYTDDELLRKGILEPGAQLLRKPFTPAELARAVRGLLRASER